MRLLVTGGVGFIGSAFIRRCASAGDFEISIIDKLSYAADKRRLEEYLPGVEFYKADLAERADIEEIIKRARPDVIVHFAAETHVDRSILYPDQFFKANITGTANLLAAALQSSVKKFVHVSTDEVYGDLPADKSVKFTEASPFRPNSPYSASKAGADLIVRAYQKTYGLPALILRPSNNYGPWQFPEKLIPLTIAKALMGEKIPVYGKGRNVRTWLFVEDCAEAILLAMERGGAGEVYNIGSDEEKVNIDVVKGILDLLGKGHGLIEFVPDRLAHDFRYALDSSKIRNELGWRTKNDFATGLEKTVRWYADNRDWLFAKKAEIEGFLKDLKARFAEKA